MTKVRDSDSQDNKLARLDYEDASGNQCKSNDKHDEGAEYEAAEDEHSIPSAH